jgi:hypothetical protein
MQDHPFGEDAGCPSHVKTNPVVNRPGRRARWASSPERGTGTEDGREIGSKPGSWRAFALSLALTLSLALNLPLTLSLFPSLVLTLAPPLTLFPSLPVALSTLPLRSVSGCVCCLSGAPTATRPKALAARGCWT